jgi:effector-binding domain-containing protein
MLGRKLTTLVKGLEKKGSHEVIFNAGNLPSGIYLYTIYSGSYKKTSKLLLLK